MPRGSNAAATPANSSGSSSSGSASNHHHNTNNSSSQFANRKDSRSHSGELSYTSPICSSEREKIRSTSSSAPSRPGHRRSASAGAPFLFPGKALPNSGTSYNASASSTAPSLLPAGNICPSGKISKPVINTATSSAPGRNNGSNRRHDVLGSGTGNYGHGSIMRGGGGHARFASAGSNGDHQHAGVDARCVAEAVVMKKAMASLDPEEVKAVGNDMYRKGNFVEALGLYDRAISISPENAAYRGNKAATLAAMGRVGEAVVECEEAVRLDYGYLRAHQRLASLYLR